MKGVILKINSIQISRQFLTFEISRCAAVCTAALLMAGYAQAQTIYRLVDAEGRVTFTDKVVPSSVKATTLSAEDGRTAGASGAALPFELRLVVSKYPVTLYTSSGCVPCGSGRKLLVARGIPFTEKTVSTADDTEALQRVSGGGSLPLLTIGGQQIKGFSESEWTQFLNAAGYPPTSMLPARYRNAEISPLVTLQKQQPVAKTDESQNQRAPAPITTPTDNTSSNPAGIKF
jgi:glutaredoxin